VIFGLLIAILISVTHAPGWSDPVLSIEIPCAYDFQESDLIVTDGNHVHQIWYRYLGIAASAGTLLSQMAPFLLATLCSPGM
jgi:hypothetical protein